MKVSIIVVNYNTLQVTSECIRSVFDMTVGVSFEFILVDNASKDGSREYFSQDKRIKYIYIDENLGFGRANNLGIKEAKGDYILFLNPDTILLNNAIKIMADYLDYNQDVGACGGNLYDAKMNPVISFERCFPSICSEINLMTKGYLYKLIYGKNYKFNHTGKPFDVAYIVGADLMMRRSLTDKIGGFDSHFFMYFEEVELCYRIKKQKFSIHRVPSAEIQHLEGVSTKSSNWIDSLIRNETLRLQGRKTYYELTHTPAYHKIANLIRLMYLYSRILIVKDKDALRILRSTLNRFRELYS